MALKEIQSVDGKAVYVAGDDIDTDRIIPARFMKCVTFEGLGQYAFYDVRFDSQGKSTNHPMDTEENKGASVLISGANFGCGSSREHAPQALFHWGIRAVIAISFAEIFFGNCTTLGIPCVTITKENLKKLADLLSVSKDKLVKIELNTKKIILEGAEIDFTMPENARQSLMKGQWDSLASLLEDKEQVKSLASSLAYTQW
jgi:3-isopropylmalate/(R)-2-methylmalate dehydratase small subunit